jgi:hypothetical protein
MPVPEWIVGDPLFWNPDAQKKWARCCRRRETMRAQSRAGNRWYWVVRAAKGTQRSLTRMTAGFQFNYSFDWHTGVSDKAFSGNTQ